MLQILIDLLGYYDDNALRILMKRSICCQIKMGYQEESFSLTAVSFIKTANRRDCNKNENKGSAGLTMGLSGF